MGFYEELEKGLLEAIEMEKGNIPVVQKENLLAETWCAYEGEKFLIDELIALRKEKGVSQKQLAVLAGSKQQVISRLERKEHSPSLKLFCSIVNALGYDLKIVKRK